jgi:hypothetical protein
MGTIFLIERSIGDMLPIDIGTGTHLKNKVTPCGIAFEGMVSNKKDHKCGLL